MGKRYQRFIVGLGMVLMLAWTAGAQDAAVLTGSVRDAHGVAVPTAVVTVTAPDLSVVRVVATDQRGEYSIGDLVSGQEYAVEVSHPDFRKLRMRVRVSSPEQDLQLRLRAKRER
jgi:hypothetical protein